MNSLTMNGGIKTTNADTKSVTLTQSDVHPSSSPLYRHQGGLRGKACIRRLNF
jgi:hypothetical protein